MTAETVALIVAAGRGERLGAGGGPKQYRMLGTRTILARTAAIFLDHRAVDKVLVVIHPDDVPLYRNALPADDKLLQPVFGGATRQQSVRNGLEALAAAKPALVLIHDAARAFVSGTLISQVLAAVAPGGGAIPGRPVSDTLKRVDTAGLVGATISRDGLYAVQTPQGFDFDAILAAHRMAAASGAASLTDDAAVAARAGMPIRLVPSSEDNMKITTAEDFEAARRRVSEPFGTPDIRTGNGYDVHRLAEGDHVTLCGVRIAHDRALLGHSDADVGLHALTDALLGTIGDGDIGSHFPPSDVQWKDASSDRFLAHAARLVADAGGTITNLDVTLVCEAPKIGPHREAMRARIATIAGVKIGRVSVKATTNETIGFVGRKEGIAAIATATAVFTPVGNG